MSSASRSRLDSLRRLELPALAVGLVILAACAILAFWLPQQFFRAYLASYHFVLGLGLGCWVLLNVYLLSGGAWGFVLRRILEAGSRTLPLLAVLFLPLAFGLEALFPWTRPENQSELHQKALYLNLPFFYLRAGFFFVGGTIIVFLLYSLSRRQDRDGDPALVPWFQRVAALGLIFYGVSLQFLAIDWLMSLDLALHSTIVGPLLASRHLVTSMALVAIVLCWLAPEPALARFLSKAVLLDVGTLVFAFLVIWAYMVFFQFMLVWMANIRYEVTWYLPRGRDGWLWAVWALVGLGFAVPFFLLLFRDVKRSPVRLTWVAGLILLMQLLFSFYEVVPEFPGTTLADNWMDFVLPFGLVGVWLACFLWQLRVMPLVPAHDPHEATALHYRHRDEEEAVRLREMAHG